MLNEHQLQEIEKLKQLCEEQGEFRLKLNWDTLLEGKEIEHELLYKDGKLVGFLAVYRFGKEYELCGMVHPSYRGQGLFSQMVSKAVGHIPKGEEILLNAPSTSDSARLWLEGQPVTYSFSEFQMKWNSQLLSEEDHIRLEPAKEEDINWIMEANRQCFGYSYQEEQELKRLIHAGSESDSCYMIKHDEETIGKIQVRRKAGESWGVGFAVLPQFQGKGYGRKSVLQALSMERETGNAIFLEVAHHNHNAMKLYKDYGFEEYQTQDYYIYNRK
ncbi:MAG: GNAT family N-acetyltransferase [Bacillus sp. (in: firmicutes)]